jgi:hypothetical protein
MTIELTAEMIEASAVAFGKAYGDAPRGAGAPAGRRASLEAALKIVERDYTVTRRTKGPIY